MLVKKLLIIFAIMLICAAGVFAADGWDSIKKGWARMPIKVYMEDMGDKNTMMQSAFSDWQSKTGGKVRFAYVTKPHAGYAHITVSLVTNCTHEAAGLTSATMGVNRIAKSHIDIGTHDPKTQYEYTDEELKIIMRHEIGHALGLKHSSNPKSIMFPTVTKGMSIIKEDLDNIMELY